MEAHNDLTKLHGFIIDKYIRAIRKIKLIPSNERTVAQDVDKPHFCF